MDEPPPSQQGEDDELFQAAITHATETGMVSVTLLQEHFGIGFNRAHNLIDALEDHGVIGPSPGSFRKLRKVLIGEPAEATA
ncbi:DNA translocase FtsK [Marinobacter sp. CA1]|uniref:DNA translocase FtsK n=1 Tax=Marinobacter sp. CA1 TaxID=2817656 RepID=UPI002B4B1B68|nr:DNA translocase FtsK [Marinobacter sp. CA1]